MRQQPGVAVPAGLEPVVLEAAARAHVSAGEWLRRAIERALAEGRGTPDALTRLASLDAPTSDIDLMLTQIEAGRS